jgi:hypothetical protein
MGNIEKSSITLIFMRIYDEFAIFDSCKEFCLCKINIILGPLIHN